MKKILAILLTVAMIFSFAACKSEEKLTTNKVLKLADKLADGEVADNSDLSGYECVESENVYKTYTYTIDDETSVIVTTDKETGETLQMYLFRGTSYINLKEGKDAVKEFLEGDIKEITTEHVDKKKRTTTTKKATTTTTKPYQTTNYYTAAQGTTAATTAATTTAAPETTTAATTAPSTTAATTTAAPETTTAAQ